MRIIAFVTDYPAIHCILTYVGEPTAPPEVAAARGAPLWQQAAQLHWDDSPAPAPSVRVRPAGNGMDAPLSPAASGVPKWKCSPTT
jgi:hypothetical protein